MRLAGKRALVTGGARGIGRAIAARFVQEGARVFILDYRGEQLDETVGSIRGQNNDAQVDCAVCDLGEPEQVECAAEQAWGRWDGLDILVNNAGMAVRELFVEIPFSHWNRILNVNVNAMFWLSQNVAKRMAEQGAGGAIVNMASKNGLAGSAKLAHYNASKGAVVLLTQSMAVELAAYAIRVNAVAPGFIATPLDLELKAKEGLRLEPTHRTPMRRMGTVEEVANAFLFLASDEASYITGTTLVVDGGHLANASEL